LPSRLIFNKAFFGVVVDHDSAHKRRKAHHDGGMLRDRNDHVPGCHNPSFASQLKQAVKELITTQKVLFVRRSPISAEGHRFPRAITNYSFDLLRVVLREHAGLRRHHETPILRP